MLHLNITINQGLAGARRILPIIDLKEKISEDKSLEKINLIKVTLNLKNVNFNYNEEDKVVLKRYKFIYFWWKNDISSWS